MTAAITGVIHDLGAPGSAHDGREKITPAKVYARLGIDDRRVASAFGGAVIEVFVGTRDIEAATG